MLFWSRQFMHCLNGVFGAPKPKSKPFYYQKNFPNISSRIKYDTEKYGRIYYAYDGQQQIMLIGSYDAAKQYYNLTCHDNIRQFDYLGYVFDKLFKKCIGANYGSKWLEMKKPLAAFFTTKSFESQFDVIYGQVVNWMTDTLHNNKQIELNKLNFDKLTIGIISHIVYGKLTEAQLMELYELSKMHEKIMQMMSKDLIMRTPIVYKFLSTPNSKYVDLFWNKWMRFNSWFYGMTNSNSLFEHMLKYDVYADNILFLQTLYEIVLFNADIMTDAFSNLVKNLALNDDVRKKLYLECSEIKIGGAESLSKCQYLTAVINESARLDPGVTITFPETTTTDIVVDGYTIPASTLVSLDTQMINRDPTLWDLPNKFDPERFMGQNSRELMFKFHRFGLDQRKCLGNVYGDLILKIVTVLLLQNYDFTISRTFSDMFKESTISNLSSSTTRSVVKFCARK